MARIAKILTRSDTSANWSKNNPVLGRGECGLATDLKRVKYGDGKTKWNDLSWADAGTVNGHTVNADVPSGAKFTDTTYSTATQSANGLLSSADKKKLDGIAAGAQVNSVTSVAGRTGAVTLAKGDVGLGNVANLNQSKAIASITRDGTTFTATALDGTTTTFTQQDTNTTYSDATQSTHGLMSTTDKKKLDGIAANANNYSLPTATSSVLGGVKTGSNITNSSGIISLSKDNVTSALGYVPATQNVATESAHGLLSAADKKALDREFFRMLPNGGTVIPAGADLNSVDYIKVGNYYQCLDSNTKDMTNIPIKGAFLMYVLSPLSASYDNELTSNWVYRLRIFVNYCNKGIYTQFISSGSTAGMFTYGAWTKLAVTKSDVGLGNVANFDQSKAIKSITRSGTTFTATALDGTTTTFTQQDNNTTYSTGTSSASGLTKLYSSTGSATDGTLTQSAITTELGKKLDKSSSAASANKLTTPRTIALSGAVTGTATSFDGSANITIPTTSVQASSINGVIGLDHLPQGALERLVTVANDTARFKLTTSEVQLGDTVKVTATGLMYIVVDESKLSSDAGYTVYTAGSAASVPWSGVTGKPSNASKITDGFMSASDKTKLDGIESGANAYTLPTASSSTLGGIKVGSNLTINNGVLSGTPNTTYSDMTGATTSAAGTHGLVPAPSSGAANRYLRSDGTWTVPPDTNTTYSAATQSANGLMSAADKTKLDGIASGAQVNAVTSVAGKIGAVTLAKGDVGLGNVDNTSDANKHVYEAKLNWGGQSISGDVSPVDAAMSSNHSANRIAFAKPAGITIEYSNDSGSTWTDYGATDAVKISLVSGIGTALYIGKHNTNSTVTIKDKLRVTINATNCGFYTNLKKVLLNISTSGAGGANVILERSYKGSETTWSTVGTYRIDGWSGWNSIPIMGAFGGGTTQTGNMANLRFTLGITSLSSNTNNSNALTLIDLQMFGTTWWSYNSNMAKSGHLYSWDTAQNATFPAQVTATQFNGKLNGTVNSHTINADVPSDAKFTDTTYSAATTSAAGLMSASDKSKLDGIAEKANNYTLPTATADTLGGVKLYTGTGTATDGTMTQKAITESISSASGTVSSLTTLVPVTLASSSWTSSDSKYSQSVTVSGVTADSIIEVFGNIGAPTSADDQKAYARAYRCVVNGYAIPGSSAITFTTYKKPAIDITVYLKIVSASQIKASGNSFSTASVTLATGSWTSSSGIYSQQVTVSGVSSSSNVEVYSGVDSSMNATSQAAYMKAYRIVTNGYTVLGSGAITFKAFKKPATSIAVKLKITS